MESNSGLTTCPSALGWGRGRGRGRGRGGAPGRGAMRGHHTRDPQREDAVGPSPQDRRGNLHVCVIHVNCVCTCMCSKT